MSSEIPARLICLAFIATNYSPQAIRKYSTLMESIQNCASHKLCAT